MPTNSKVALGSLVKGKPCLLTASLLLCAHARLKPLSLPELFLTTIWVRVSVLPLTDSMPLGKSFKSSELKSP